MKKASFIYPTYKTPTCRVTVKRYYDESGKRITDKMESIKSYSYEEASIDDGRPKGTSVQPTAWFVPKDNDWED